ncbi:IS110 family transposase [Actinomadura sp. RB99]|uniref:IS110 family transposase n=1 Tax=Actinomadura sp. RB99 TaxID=2691577 RepID=UPI0016890679
MAVPQIWAGVDAGKTHHHCVVIDADGKRLLSRRVANDEPELLTLIGDVLDLGGGPVMWATDLADGGAALLIGLLASHEQDLLYIPGRVVNKAAGSYRGVGKTDAKDAAIIADQARMRRDLHPMRVNDELVVELKLLTARRSDLVHDRTRVVSRLRELLTSIFPALERVLDVTNTGPLLLLTGYQTPASLRRIGRARLETWLKHRHVRGAAQLAQTAVDAGDRQRTQLPGEALTAQMIETLAREVMVLNEQVKAVEKLIEGRFRRHESAEVITSLPGIGTVLGAEFLAVTGGDMSMFGSPDKLASFAGLAPVPRDSGRVHGNLHRPERYHRGLQRVFYTSALISIQRNPESRSFYDRKRREGKHHNQAVLALARRRVNVLWALLRDGRCYQLTPPVTAAA